MPAWEGLRDRWLTMVDQKGRRHAAVVLEEQTFWEQAPSDFEEADNPSALLQSIVSWWLRWAGPVQGRAGPCADRGRGAKLGLFWGRWRGRGSCY